jgi:phosphate transport system permease protein
MSPVPLEPSSTAKPEANRPFAIQKERTRFLGLTFDECIQAFFGGNAFVAVIVLGLITFFLFREGVPFFAQNRDNLVIYRKAGLEYVDFIRQQERDHSALSRYLSDLRLRTLRHYTDIEKLPLAEAQARLALFDDFATRYSDASDTVRGFVSDLGDVAKSIKERNQLNLDAEVKRLQLRSVGKNAEADAVETSPINFGTELVAITAAYPDYHTASVAMGETLTQIIATPPALPSPELQVRMARFVELTNQYVAGFPAIATQLQAWDFQKPIPLWKAFTTFIGGHEWLTASFWQDIYGVLPLLLGSLLISVIALSLAVPLGVGAAIYVNQLATTAEQRTIKPAIEFISAIPSVVLGFFGIAVLGAILRTWSQSDLVLPIGLQSIPIISWLLNLPLVALNGLASVIPGFPFAERLNALTAGCLLGLIATPTIFTLAEDAINNVPRAFKEASYALGATRLQTVVRIIVPAAFSGIVSAVLLGLGRVIGETMVVLLCAGNRIAIPDFTAGLSVITQPVHTMTGIIAQELGEVVPGSIHYRALFVVGLLLFFIALLINYIAQKIVRKYRTSIG